VAGASAGRDPGRVGRRGAAELAAPPAGRGRAHACAALSGLVAEGAHPMAVDLPDAAEARSLLAGRLGEGRIAAEPLAVEEIVGLCVRPGADWTSSPAPTR
jgi:hypothetical protein